MPRSMRIPVLRSNIKGQGHKGIIMILAYAQTENVNEMVSLEILFKIS